MRYVAYATGYDINSYGPQAISQALAYIAGETYIANSCGIYIVVIKKRAAFAALFLITQ